MCMSQKKLIEGWCKKCGGIVRVDKLALFEPITAGKRCKGSCAEYRPLFCKEGERCLIVLVEDSELILVYAEDGSWSHNVVGGGEG